MIDYRIRSLKPRSRTTKTKSGASSPTKSAQASHRQPAASELRSCPARTYNNHCPRQELPLLGPGTPSTRHSSSDAATLDRHQLLDIIETTDSRTFTFLGYTKSSPFIYPLFQRGAWWLGTASWRGLGITSSLFFSFSHSPLSSSSGGSGPPLTLHLIFLCYCSVDGVFRYKRRI